jgi:hypothetical protein
MARRCILGLRKTRAAIGLEHYSPSSFHTQLGPKSKEWWAISTFPPRTERVEDTMLLESPMLDTGTRRENTKGQICCIAVVGTFVTVLMVVCMISGVRAASSLISLPKRPWQAWPLYDLRRLWAFHNLDKRAQLSHTSDMKVFGNHTAGSSKQDPTSQQLS